MPRLRRALPVARVVVFGAAIAGAVGCDTAKSPSTTNTVNTGAPPPTGLPPLEGAKGAAATPTDRPEHASTGTLPAGHPPVGGAGGAGAAMGMGGGMGGGMEGTTPGNIPFDPKSVIAGELRLDAKVKDKVKAGDTIFLVVRSVDKPGPPLAVKKLVAGSWPLAFTIDGRDAMVPGTQLAGKVSVNVRVDKDGDAITKNPGDVTGTASITPPADKVVVTLDTVL
jgi:hypothetical protein